MRNSPGAAREPIDVHAAEQTHFRTCPLCEATCGLAIKTRGTEVVSVRGDDDDVFSAGFLCPKGSTVGKLHADPDRLREPLLKKNGRHVAVSWAEAWAAVDEGLREVHSRSGRESVAVYLGNPNVHNMGGAFFVRPFLQALRTRNVYTASTVDQMPRHVSSGLLYGAPDAIPVPDLDRTQYLLMLGANPLESNGSLCTAPDFPGRLEKLRKRGGKLVVVDPRKTRTAKIADAHLSIRPATDAHFLLAIAKVLFDEGLVSTGSLEEHLEGAEPIRDAISDFTPEAASLRTGIDADTIVRVARELADAQSAAVYTRIGVHTNRFGTLASWAADLVCILTGNFDRAGGLMFPLAPLARPRRVSPGKGFSIGRWHSRVRDLPEVKSEFPIAALAEEILTEGEGRIRALFTIAGNPALSAPNAGTLGRALASLNFMVSVDPYLNETTRHADVVLPPPSILERTHFDVAFTSLSVRNVANYSAAVFETDAPSECDLLAKLTLIAAGAGADADPEQVFGFVVRGLVEREVGQKTSPIFGRDADEIVAAVAGCDSAERILDVLLQTGPYGAGFGKVADGLSLEKLRANPHGIDLGALEPGLPEVLRTPSGKIEVFSRPIAEDLARLRADLATPANDERIQLIGRRTVRSNNSWMHNVDVLVRGRDRCTLQIHPEDAARLGLKGGGRVRIASRVGSVEAPAEITDEIRAGVVSLPHGYGHDQPGASLSVAAKTPGVNSNRLTDELPLDPLSGNAVLNGIPVTLSAATD